MAEQLHPSVFINNLMEMGSLSYEDAIDRCQTFLERGIIYINSDGFVEIVKPDSMKSKLGYSRIGRNNV